MKALSCHGGIQSYPLLIGLLGPMLLAVSPAASQPTAVLGWGWNNNAQARPPAGLTNVIDVSAGTAQSLALRDNGTVVSWGVQYGPVPPGLTNVMAIASGKRHDLALLSNGTVVAWGDNLDGKTKVPAGLSNVIAVAGGGIHSLALKMDGTVVAWGTNRYGEVNVPPGLSNVIAISAGGDHTLGAFSLALKSDGTVVAWGSNRSGQTNVPRGLSNVVAIAASPSIESLALKSDGTVVIWGGPPEVTPAGLTNVVAIAAGSGNYLALRVDGTVVGWGDNFEGSLNIPATARNARAIAFGNWHGLVLTRSTPPPWPRITQHPRSQRALDGQVAEFGVSASASAPLNYQWQYRGQNIPNETNSGLVLFDLKVSDSGDYAVVVTADGLSARSAPAFLAVSNPPVAQAQTGVGLEDTDLMIELDGIDPSALPLTAQIVQLPAAGRLFQFDANGRGDPIEAVPTVVMDPNWRVIYVPDANGNGPEFDKLLFVVNNEIGDSLPAKVRIDIASVNDAPSFVVGADQIVAEDAGRQVVTGWASHISAGPPDESDQALAFIVDSDNHALFSELPAIDATGTLTFTAASNAHGTATVTIRLMDDGGTGKGGLDKSEPQTFVIRVLPVNDAPTARILADGLLVFPSDFEHPVLISCNWWNSCLQLNGSMSSDPEGDTLSYLWFVVPDPAAFSASAVTTNCLEVGTHAVILTATDSAGLSDTDTLTFEVLTAPLAIELLIEEINEAGKAGIALSRKIKRELTATLRAALHHAGREQLRDTQKALDAFEKKVRAQLAKTHPEAATAWVRWSQAVSEGIQNCIELPWEPQDTVGKGKSRADKGGDEPN